MSISSRHLIRFISILCTFTYLPVHANVCWLDADSKGQIMPWSTNVPAPDIAQFWVRDLNRDGYSDFLWLNKDNTFGSMTFNPASGEYNTPFYAGKLLRTKGKSWLGDVTGDGLLDFIYNDQNQGREYRVLIGNYYPNDSVFQLGLDSPAGKLQHNDVGYNRTAQWVADVTGDGRVDLIYNRNHYRTYFVKPGRHDGTFNNCGDDCHYTNGWVLWDGINAATRGNGNVNDKGLAQWVADINGDGRADWIYQDGADFYAHLGLASGAMGPEFKAGSTSVFSPRGYTTPVWFEDLNDDKRADYIWIEGDTMNVYVALTDANGKWQGMGTVWASIPGHVTSDFSDIQFVDLNHDSWRDFVVASGNEYVVHLNVGNGFASPSTIPITPKDGVQFGDINHDGRPDAIYPGQQVTTNIRNLSVSASCSPTLRCPAPSDIHVAASPDGNYDVSASIGSSSDPRSVQNGLFDIHFEGKSLNETIPPLAEMVVQNDLSTNQAFVSCLYGAPFSRVDEPTAHLQGVWSAVPALPAHTPGQPITGISIAPNQRSVVSQAAAGNELACHGAFCVAAFEGTLPNRDPLGNWRAFIPDFGCENGSICVGTDDRGVPVKWAEHPTHVAQCTGHFPDWIVPTDHLPNSNTKKFVLSQDYPNLPIEREDATSWSQAFAAPNGPPWLQYDFTDQTEIDNYMAAIRTYIYGDVFANNPTAASPDWDTEAGRLHWVHAPLMNYSMDALQGKTVTGVSPGVREPLRGMTRERTLRPTERHFVNSEVENFAVSYYNIVGGNTIAETWNDPNPQSGMSAPDPTASQFPMHTVAFKILFTAATDSQLTDPNTLKDAPTVTISVAGKLTEVRLLQMDIAVRDPRATATGWVFGTFAYNAALPETGPSARPWNRMAPVGLMWGNELSQSLFSDLRPSYAKDINPPLGHQGRMNGPVDNPISSCLSCHSTAQAPVMAPVVYGKQCTPDQQDYWFRTLAGSEPFGFADTTNGCVIGHEPPPEHAPPPAPVAADYSLQTAHAMELVNRYAAINPCAVQWLDGQEYWQSEYQLAPLPPRPSREEATGNTIFR